ncbi:MAG: hypothetical protein AAB834_07950, partial [Patescibacteria group bacterium]
NAFSEDNEQDRECKDKYEILGNEGTTYLVCSVIDTSTFAIGQLDGAISSLLTIDVKDIFDDKDVSNSYHVAWNSFRFFALGLLVLAALVMVASQAAGLGIVDAYTMRKLLPRLLFSAVAISLSWDFMEFLTQLSNDAGNGMRTLIYAPFRDLANAGGSIGGGSLFALTLIGTGAALGFGFIGLLSFVVTGLLASLVAIAVLVLRKMLIILLVMMAPLALAAYVLPNTQKLWDLWKSSFVAVLVVFPIIMGFIAIGRVMSVTAFNSPGSATVNQLIAIIAYFGPYFLITFAFRLAGGLVATIGGVMNDRSKGAFDRLKNFRGNKANENMGKMATGRRFQGKNPLARAFNTTTFGATTFAKSKTKFGIINPFQNSADRKLLWEKVSAQQRLLNGMRYAKTEGGQVAGENEYILRAQTYTNEAEARANLVDDWDMYEKNDDGTYKLDENGDRVAQMDDMEHMISVAKANGGWSRDAQEHAGMRLFHTGTGYDNLRQAQETIQRVAGNNRELASAIAYEGNRVTAKPEVGRADLKIGHSEYVQLYDDAAANPEGKLSDARLAESTMKAIKGNDAFTMSHGRTMVMENVMPVLTVALESARATANNPNAGVDDQGRSLQDLAREESGRLTGIIEQYTTIGMQQATPTHIKHIQELTAQPTAELRRDVQREASDTMLVRDP